MRLANRPFRLFLKAYPKVFRRRFGEEMEATFAAALSRAQTQGRAVVVGVWVKTILEFVTCGLRERMRASRTALGQMRTPRNTEPRRNAPERLRSLVRDLMFAERSLRRRPLFALTAILTLGLGIGINTAVFSVVHGVLLRPLRYESPGELVVLWPNRSFSAREVKLLRENSRLLDGIATVAGWSVALTEVDEPTLLNGARTSANVFSLLGIAPALGRTFSQEDVAVGANPVVMLSHATWSNRFGADEAAVGSSLMIDGSAHEVVGVMPSGFEIFDPTTEVWIPLVEDPTTWEYTGNVSRVVARLAPGATLDALRVEFAQLLARAREALGYPDNFGAGASIGGLKETLTGDYQTMLLVLLGAVGFILLIAGSNLSSLLLSKAVDRRRELAVRTALGATRIRLVQAVLADSTLLSVAGAAVGVALAFGGVAVIKQIIPAETPRAAGIAVDATVLLVGLGLALFTGLLFGLAPASVLTRLNLQSEVGVTRGSTVARQDSHRLRQGLVIAQIALAVMLVVGAGVMIRSVGALAAVRPGFDYNRVLTLRLRPVGDNYTAPAEHRRFYIDLIDRIEALPGVLSAGAVQHIPLAGVGWSTSLEIEGQPVPAGRSKPNSGWRIVAGRYFESMGIQLIDGRSFDAADDESGVPVAVVNQTFARRFWRGESPLGRRIKHGRNSDTWVTVVGVVEDVSHFRIGQDAQPELYRPHTQTTMPALSLAVRTSQDPALLIRRVLSDVWAIDPDVPVSHIAPLSDVVAASYNDKRMVTTLLAVFAAVALSLGAIGVYGVTSFGVSRRTNEIGIRMALGASGRRVRADVLRSGTSNALAGIAIGLAGAWGLSRFLEGLVFEVSATDPITFVGVAAMILTVALASAYLPARRATKIDPSEALRAD